MLYVHLKNNYQNFIFLAYTMQFEIYFYKFFIFL